MTIDRQPSLFSLARVTVVTAACAVFVLGCPKAKTDAVDGGASETGAAVATHPIDAGTGDDGGSDDVEPVYPIEPNKPPVPLAAKLCEGLTTLQEKKRSACCNTTPGIVLATECTRLVSAALRHNALELAERDVDTCIAALDKSLEGCDWVGPFPLPPPAECQGIFKGKTTAGAKCRSSLECQGDMHCGGLTPTSPGRCAPPGVGGEACGAAVDPLVSFARQSSADKRHPDCKERCIKHHCAPPVAEGGACLITADCRDGLQCLPAGAPSPKLSGPAPKKCVTGKPPGKDGEACPGGLCEEGLQCVRGKCAVRKAAGLECTDDFECKGGCLKGDGGTKGKCGPRCDIR